MNHTQARALIVAGFTSAFGRPPTRPEAQCEQAVGFLETNYCQSWKGPGVGSCNWGAEQGVGPAGFFTYTDTHPNADGTSKPYTAKFQKFHSESEGAETLTADVYMHHNRGTLVLPFAKNGDTLSFSGGLHASGYYEGFGATIVERIEHHHQAVLHACRLMALELGEPMPDGSAPEPLPASALHQGMISMAVGVWQKTLLAAGYDVVVDNNFGPKTRTMTMLFQKKLGIKADGVVGPVTLAAAASTRA